MSNQMIALQARAPDMPSFTDYIQIREHAQDRQNAMLKQQQEQNAMLRKQAEADALNNAYGQAFDPSTGRIDATKLSGSLAQGGFGSAIPGVQQDIAKMQGAQTETSAARLKHLMEFSKASRDEFGNAASPEDAVGRAQRLAQAFPDMAPHLQAGLADMPQDPAAFAQWKQGVLRKNLTAEQQLKQHFQAQTTGDGVRVLSIPEYGTGAATVVPGSEGSLPPQTQFVWGANGGNIVDTRTGQATPVTAGGGSTGGAPASGYSGQAIESAVTGAIPGVRVTSRQRSPAKNASVNGAANSYHLTDQARDFVPPPGMSMGDLYRSVKAAQPGMQVINEGDHVHVEPPRGAARGGQLQQAPTAGERTAKAKVDATKSEAYSQSAIDAFDRAIASGESLLKHPGFTAAVGSGFDPAAFGSYNPFTGNSLSGTEAANFETDLETMKSQVFLPMVQSMKGLGALSNAEGQKLTAAIGNLDARQSEASFQKNMAQILSDLRKYSTRSRSGGAQPAQSAKPAANSGWSTAKVVGGR